MAKPIEGKPSLSFDDLKKLADVNAKNRIGIGDKTENLLLQNLEWNAPFYSDDAKMDMLDSLESRGEQPGAKPFDQAVSMKAAAHIETVIAEGSLATIGAVLEKWRKWPQGEYKAARAMIGDSASILERVGKRFGNKGYASILRVIGAGENALKDFTAQGYLQALYVLTEINDTDGLARVFAAAKKNEAINQFPTALIDKAATVMIKSGTFEQIKRFFDDGSRFTVFRAAISPQNVCAAAGRALTEKGAAGGDALMKELLAQAPWRGIIAERLSQAATEGQGPVIINDFGEGTQRPLEAKPAPVRHDALLLRGPAGKDAQPNS